MELREREVKLMKDQLDGLDAYAAGTSTINFVFDRYISTKAELRETTMRNYKYMYDRFIRGGFGKKKIAAVKYSDVFAVLSAFVERKGNADKYARNNSYCFTPDISACCA